MIRRGIRSGAFYGVDTKTGKRTGLGKITEDDAEQIIEAKNTAERQPILNLQIAKAYLAGSDNGMQTRTWQQAIEALTITKLGANKERWERVRKDQALTPLPPKIIIENQGEHLLKVLKAGTVSTNVFLRRLHNFCVDINWLPWPLIPKRQWPVVRFKEKRAITWEEHCRIVEPEGNPERKAFYQLATWVLRSHLHAEDVDWQDRIISFFRMKTRWRGQMPPQIRFGKEVEEILLNLRSIGPLFPYLATVRCGDRATEFKQRCAGLGIHDVTLHSYRYAWAGRAKIAGYPEPQRCLLPSPINHQVPTKCRVYFEAKLRDVTGLQRNLYASWSIRRARLLTEEKISCIEIGNPAKLRHLGLSKRCVLTDLDCLIETRSEAGILQDTRPYDRAVLEALDRSSERVSRERRADGILPANPVFNGSYAATRKFLQ